MTLKRNVTNAVGDDRGRGRDLLIVLGVALALRMLFLALTADTYDYDEFVLLLLGRDFSHGAMPYRDFMLFHPPGLLYLLGVMEPVTHAWWPAARIATALIDCATAGLVWGIARGLYQRNGALAAGLIYAASPLALVSAGRLGQDPVLTAVGMMGLWVLLTYRSPVAGAIAGVCLGAAVLIKFPGVYFLPVYVAVSPRRSRLVMPVAALTVAVGLLPFHDHLPALYQQTVTFQRARYLMDTGRRIQTTLLYWLAVNPVAAAGAVMNNSRLWLLTGFGLGGIFVLSPQVYYHYFVPVAPFGALLAGPVVARLGRRCIPFLIAGGFAITIVWGEILTRGGPSPLYVTSARFSELSPTIRFLRQTTGPKDAVLADRFEYAYLTDRPALAHYFWNVGVLVDAHYLLRRLGPCRAVVLSYGPSSGYPTGLVPYLNEHYRRIDNRESAIWTIPRQ